MSENAEQTPDGEQPPRGPLKFRDDCWMVGHRNPDSLLQCNTYVRTFRQFGGHRNVCIDPGSPVDFEIVQKHINHLFGGLSEIHAMTINHQDPDVAGNAPQFCEGNPAVEMHVSEEVWRLLQHMRLSPGRLCLSSGRTESISSQEPFQYVPTPFCHFRGAMALYDPEQRVLYSGDLFGGLNRPGQVHLMATDEDWRGIAQFHQVYMPSREVLRYAVREIMNLRPRVEVIAPQHGHVIAGDLVGTFLERMHELPVGIDLLSSDWDSQNLQGYSAIVQQLIDRAAEERGLLNITGRIQAQETDDGLHRLLRLSDGRVRLFREGYSALAKTFARLIDGEPQEYIADLRSAVIAECNNCGLPIPTSMGGFSESGSAEPE